MSLPDLDVARARRYVDERNAEMPFDARDQVRYELDVTSSSLTILERRPPWREDYGPEWTRLPVARLRYVKARREWSLYWRDRHEKFHLYDQAAPTPTIQTLLDEVTADRSASSGVEAFSRVVVGRSAPSDLVATFIGVDGYELVPDPGDGWSPTKREIRRQREFEEIRVHATRMAAESPPLSEEALRTIATFIMNRPPESELVEWRLRLFCGHVVTQRSHHTNTTVHMAFTGTVACPECGLDPATIVAAEALRRHPPCRGCPGSRGS